MSRLRHVVTMATRVVPRIRRTGRFRVTPDRTGTAAAVISASGRVTDPGKGRRQVVAVGTTSYRRLSISCTVIEIVEEIRVFGCGAGSGVVTLDVRRLTCRPSDRPDQRAEARATAAAHP